MSKQKNPTAKRFILKKLTIPSSLMPGEYFQIDSNEIALIHQLISVFRIKTGDQIILMNKNQNYSINTEFIFAVKDLHKKAISLQLITTKSISNELPLELNLALALPNKPAKLEFILEKAVELGAQKIYLIKTEMSHFPHQLRLDRLEKIILEAVEQSERAIVPQFFYFNSLAEFIGLQSKNLFVALERQTEAINLLNLPLPSTLTLLIGPEGGFSPTEKQLFSSLAIPTFQLGGSILRMETAALLALGIIRLRA